MFSLKDKKKEKDAAVAAAAANGGVVVKKASPAELRVQKGVLRHYIY